MILEMSDLEHIPERHIISLRANLDHHYCGGPKCVLISKSNDIFRVIDDPELVKMEALENLWLQDINYYGRKYIKGWVRRGLNRFDTSFCEFKSFLYLIKLSGYCNFAKRDLIYDSLKVLCPESKGGLIISRNRFKLLMIAWHYVNQAYFRRKDQVAYQQLSPGYQVDSKVIRRFERYYQMRLWTKIREI